MLGALMLLACEGPNLALGEAEADDTLGALVREALALGAEAAGGEVELLSFRGSADCGDGGRVPATGPWWYISLRREDDPSAGWACFMQEEGSLECEPRADEYTTLDPILDWTVDSPRACRRLPAEAEWLDVQSVGCMRAEFCQAYGGVDVEMPDDVPADRAAYYYHEVDALSLFPVTRVLDGVTGRMLYREGL